MGQIQNGLKFGSNQVNFRRDLKILRPFEKQRSIGGRWDGQRLLVHQAGHCVEAVLVFADVQRLAEMILEEDLKWKAPTMLVIV